MFDHFKNVFDERKREQGETIGKFLGEIKTNPETLAKKLTELERKANDKEITLEELRETLDDANAGKTPGTDEVDKDFLVRFWNMIGPTIYHAQKIFIDKEQLNEFLDTCLIKVLKKGGTKGELIKDWRPITLLSQIYKLISGAVARRLKKLLGKLISGCIQVIDTKKDDEDRILILKTIVGNETITLGCIYDDNRNNTKALVKIDELLMEMDVKQGIIIGGDYNVIVSKELDQIGYENQHSRTKAVKHLNDWDEKGTLVDTYRRKHKKGKDVTYVPVSYTHLTLPTICSV